MHLVKKYCISLSIFSEGKCYVLIDAFHFTSITTTVNKELMAKLLATALADQLDSQGCGFNLGPKAQELDFWECYLLDLKTWYSKS